MGWFILIIVAAIAIAGSSSAASKGFKASDDCKTITITDAVAGFKHSLTVMQANDWTTLATSLGEVEQRLLAVIRAALPNCGDIVPDTIDGLPWADAIAAAWARTPKPGMEAAGVATTVYDVIGVGAPFQFESIDAATTGVQAYPGTFNPNDGE